MTGVVVSKASKSFGNRWLFSDLDINVSAGQLTAITGPSGSGKSTLLNCIGLLDKLDRGQILVGGRDISRLSAERQRKFRRDIVGYMFQDYALVENATVQENLEIALVAKGRSMVRSADFDGALERVGLPRRQREQVYQLSGGEQQRDALA
ncbi:MAG: ABC transporter ATP-binding protein, partial [Glutamicibacter sp.]